MPRPDLLAFAPPRKVRLHVPGLGVHATYEAVAEAAFTQPLHSGDTISPDALMHIQALEASAEDATAWLSAVVADVYRRGEIV